MAAAADDAGNSTTISTSIIPKDLRVDGSKLTLGKLLGKGGFAEVFEATINFGKHGGTRSVAFKRMHEGVKSLAAETLAAELTVQSKVDAHPNIVKVLGAVDDPGRVGFGLVLELARFGNLFERLQDSSRSLPWGERIQIMQDVVAGVQALHEHLPNPIVHSDLKSLNVLLFDAGDRSIVAKVSDFGLAGTVKNTSSMVSKSGLGTMNWSAPEVFEDHYKQHPKSDIWSLGAIIFEVSSRKIPYAEKSQQQLMMNFYTKKSPPDVSLLESGTPTGVQDIVLECCHPDPAARPNAAIVAQKVKVFQTAAPAAASLRSMQHHENSKEMMRMIKMQAAALERIEAGVGRVEEKVDATLAAVQKSLTVVLSLVNEDCSYPRTFLVLPKVERTGGSTSSRMRRLFETCDTFQVVFLCETTLAPIK